MLARADEFKNQLREWFKDATVKMQPMTQHLKQLELNQWAQIASIASGSSASAVSALEIFARLYPKSSTDDLTRRIVNERESAANSYKQANQAMLAGSLGLALKQIKRALNEFTATSFAHSQREVWADKQLQAEMLLLKGVIQFSLKKLKSAILTLNAVLQIDENNLLAHNLLAHIYLHETFNVKAAKKHLAHSRTLASQQIFANYYLAKFNQDEAQMQKMMDQLVAVFSQSAEPQEGSTHSEAWLNLQSTTVPSLIIVILIDWLAYATSHVNEATTLATIANMGSILSQQPLEIMAHYSEAFLEVRLKALDKLASLKSVAAEFESTDLEWRESYGLLEEESDAYYLEFPSNTIGRSVLSKFESFNWDSLTLPAQQKAMSEVVAGWALYGWLSGDETLKAINQQVRAMKHLKGQTRDLAYQTLLSACASEDVIKHFLTSFIFTQRRWENIFKATLHHDSLHSVFHVMCSLSNIELLAHAKENNTLKYCQAFSNNVSEDSYLGVGEMRINPKTQAHEVLHVSYHPEQNSLFILEALNTPSRVYSRIALQDAWSLHKRFPNNFLAWEYLARKGAIYAKAPSGEVANSWVEEAEPAIAVAEKPKYVPLFQRVHDRCQAISKPSQNGFFGNSIVTDAAIYVAAVSLAYVFAKK